MTKMTALVLGLALLGAACATSEGAKATVPNRFYLPDGTLVVCTMEAETGSNIRQRVCRKVESQSAAHQNDLDKAMTAPTIQMHKGG
jgi:hypothetical protein